MKRREGKRSIFFVEEEKRESNDSFKEERMIISLIIITGNFYNYYPTLRNLKDSINSHIISNDLISKD